jgi:hypothetical protein
MRSVAITTLGKARFFAEQAGLAGANDREAVTNNLEAAIVFARSVTFHLQSQFAHAPGFDVWYAEQQQRLRNDRLGRFLLEQRNYVLKVGPAPIKRNISVSITDTLQMTAELSIKVIRGQPWYRRSPKTLVEDATYPLREWMNKASQRRRSRRAAQAAQPRNATVSDAMFFADPEWDGIPALELLNRQFIVLDGVVADAEARFLDRAL